MTDKRLIALFWERSEDAIDRSRQKYGPYCQAIAKGILGSAQDAEEVVNDAFYKAWEQIPPYVPTGLQAFFARLTRQLALNRLEKATAQKRGGGEYPLALEELSQVVGTDDDTVDRLVLRGALEQFLRSLKPVDRQLFTGRYWYLHSLKDLAAQHRMSEGAVKMRLSRLRQSLRQILEKEGLL